MAYDEIAKLLMMQQMAPMGTPMPEQAAAGMMTPPMQLAASDVQENLRRLIAKDKGAPIRKEIKLPDEQVLENLRRLIQENS